jgi:hypothetical protein
MRGSKGCKPDKKMRVIMLMLAGGPEVTRWGRPTLPWCAQGGPCVPLDAWSVAVTSLFRVVQNNRSTYRAIGSIFGVSTRVYAPDQKSCLVSSSDEIGWIGRSPTLEVFCVLNFNNTKRRHVHMFCWWQHTSRTQSFISFKINFLFITKNSNIVRHIYI